MTREEKIQDALSSTSRQEKEDKIREEIYNWDHDTLYETACSYIFSTLDNCNDKDFNDEYYEWFYHEFDDLEDDVEEEIELKVVTDTNIAECICKSSDLMWFGCKCGFVNK